MDKTVEHLTDAVCKRLFVELEASARHVHVTQKQAMALFGHDLTPCRPLSQPGQFLAQERVRVVGPKGTLERVAVLGPCRSEAQVELSLTDGKRIGIRPKVRISGDVAGTEGVTLEGAAGSVKLTQGVIAALCHIHMSPEDAVLQNVKHGDTVRLRAMTNRPVVFEHVAVRVDPTYRTFAHLDLDEANACGFQTGDLGMILH